jgi:hypothetical protein
MQAAKLRRTFLALVVANSCTLNWNLWEFFMEMNYLQAFSFMKNVLKVTLILRSEHWSFKLLHFDEGRAVSYAL